MIVLLIAIAAGAFWVGRNGRVDPPAQTGRPPAEGQTAHRDVAHRPIPVWSWVAGAAALAILLLGVAAGPPGLFGGPGLFAGLMGP